MMKKKGQGLPLNVIIIAVIVLVVLVVLFVIFTDRASEFSEKVDNTDDKIKGISVDDEGKLTGTGGDLLGAFIPFIPFFRRRKRLF
tara:strand:+ start:156 stop:413 length:258 start_codon:yes stop_codon:yes gene_type:complete